MRRENGERGRLRYAVETLCAAERARRTRAARLLSRLPDSGKIPTKFFRPCPAGVCGQPRRAPTRPRVSEPKPSAPRHDRRVATLSRSPLSRRAFAKAGPLLAKRPARQAATRRSADSRHPDQQTRIPPTSPTGSHSAPRTRVRRRMRAGQSPSDQRSTGCGRVPGKIARGEYRGKAMSTHTVQRPSRRSSSEAAHVRAAARAPAAGRNGRRFRVVPGCRRAARIDSCARAGKPHPADRCVRAGACIRVRATPRLF
ncbi:Uncharacterised protein [Burkholderia pseudomallei]|nr:hypothetical protein DP46_4727 [Burkholderia pseudomallei]AIP44452.1 hypothetical protein DR56_5726 [Burkholderia pseudomallei MSHR5858]AJW89068.1 hypothetical protein BG92_5856 [Burkholderia pseudomallei 406e]AJX26206.1 hypothetical protein AQ15_4776 [Burkholderia pseudomallei K96243]AIP68600.1 hypothetical protein DU27_3763 [Burkholderia pseudomallei]